MRKSQTTVPGTKLKGLMGILVLSSAAIGCGADGAWDEGPTPSKHAVIGGGVHYVPWSWVFYDDSVPSVHIAVTYCQSPTVARSQNIICGAHADYALVGGGARTIWAQGQGTALLTQNHAYDDYFWQVRSTDNQTVSNHTLEVFAIGMRLDGVNTQTLRDQIALYTLSDTNSLSVSQSLTDGLGLSGGFSLPDNAYATSLKGLAAGGWAFTGSALGNTVPLKWSSNSILRLAPAIIEGFGALQMQQVQGSELALPAGGVQGSITNNITSGWALVGVGTTARTTSGPGRLLSAVGPAYGSARRIHGAVVENTGNSAGYMSVFRNEVRKVAGSHGMCMTGAKLNASMDACVAKICQASSRCCSTTWDAACVAKVDTVCGNKTCSLSWTCSQPTFDPNWWIADQNQANSPRTDTNCYGYAVNTADNRQPGASHYSGVGANVQDTARAAAADGLLPIAAGQTCPSNMNKLALFMRNDNGDYHWLRQNSDGQTWSHKRTGAKPKNTDSAGQIIYNPETADLTESSALKYNIFGGYFCACTGPNQGEGRAKTAYPPPYKEYASPWAWAEFSEFWL